MENNESLGFIFLLVYVLFLLIAILIGCVSTWKLFDKAGKPGWTVLVPVYNLWVMAQVIYGDDKGIKSLLAFVPFVGGLVPMLFLFRLAQVFGKETVFCVLNMFFGVVTMPMLAFGDAKYNGPIDATL